MGGFEIIGGSGDDSHETQPSPQEGERKKKVYYAHFMAIYHTPQEERDIATLEALGFEVINPADESFSKDFTQAKENANTNRFQDLYSGYISRGDSLEEAEEKAKNDAYMLAFDAVFFEAIRSADLLAFRALPDGRISGGVALEIEEAIKQDKPVIELPSSLKSRRMTKEQTIEYLQEIGER